MDIKPKENGRLAKEPHDTRLKYGFAFTKSEIRDILKMYRAPRDLTDEQIDELKYHQIPNNALIDQTRFALEFYLEHDRFPTIEEEMDDYDLEESFDENAMCSIRYYFDYLRDRKDRREEYKKLEQWQHVLDIKHMIGKMLPQFEGNLVIMQSQDWIVHGIDLTKLPMAALQYFMEFSEWPQDIKKELQGSKK